MPVADEKRIMGKRGTEEEEKYLTKKHKNYLCTYGTARKNTLHSAQTVDKIRFPTKKESV